ncbi:hypothetical protein Vretimale_16087 [Volvox reticuliferus]|uniref:1,4-dihydroxy-2-naphthoate octaprenyltransferase n=1 Tax=Volvox reticuliferus TaxID=1737510 RepID=A0A8J4GT75_9CHLO|nr:hypothetical protein Vretifemale_9679 [Volvox reticuliferus]GIM12854.1 hypothetical protein Vretimale_16087 [Volvox reticuliferus]
MSPVLAQQSHTALCGGQSALAYPAPLQPAIFFLRRQAHCATGLTSFAARRTSTCAGPPSSGLVVEIFPSIPREADVTTTTVVDPASGDASNGESHSAHTQTSPEISATQPGGLESAQQDRRKLWFAAVKPPMYSVGFVPVLVAAACVFFEFGVLPWGRVMGFVLAAILVIAWLNLSNDAFDAHTGVDASKPESVVNLLGGGPKNRRAVLLLAKSLLVAGVALLAHLISSAPGGDLRPVGLLAFSIACGYIYQGPPFRLSYKGLGEPLCFFAFGPSALTAFYLALRPDDGAAAMAAAGSGFTAALVAGVPPAVWACSIVVGLTTTVILFCSHFHQIAGDTAAGKRSPLVRLGTERGRKVLRAAAVATQAAALVATAAGALPWAAAPATLLAAPAARAMVAFADEHHLVPERVAPLKRFAVSWHMQYGLCLCLGLAAARLLAGHP